MAPCAPQTAVLHRSHSRPGAAPSVAKSLAHTRSCPPYSLPTVSPADVRRGACSHFEQGCMRLKQKNVVSWAPASGVSGDDDRWLGAPLVYSVGDSYADCIDMGFHCWPALLAKRLGYSLLNVAKGGSKSWDAASQLALAHDFAEERLMSSPADDTPAATQAEPLLLLHTGGNDVLFCMRFPPVLLLLLLDLLRISLGRWGVTRRFARAAPPRYSFFGWAATRLRARLQAFTDTAVSRGHRAILICTPPICAPMPLARALLRLFVPFASCGFISATLREVSLLFSLAVREAIGAASANHPSATIVLFDESRLLDQLADEADAGGFGLLHVPALLWARHRRGRTPMRSPSLLPPSASSSEEEEELNLRGMAFWHDAHHPSSAVHHKLAEHARLLLKEANAAPLAFGNG